MKMISIDIDSIEAETDLAILVSIDDEKVWIPRSVCKVDEDDDNILSVEQWFAEKEGLI